MRLRGLETSKGVLQIEANKVEEVIVGYFMEIFNSSTLVTNLFESIGYLMNMEYGCLLWVSRCGHQHNGWVRWYEMVVADTVFFSPSFFFIFYFVKNDFNETWKNLKIEFWIQKPKAVVTTRIVTINPHWNINQPNPWTKCQNYEKTLFDYGLKKPEKAPKH